MKRAELKIQPGVNPSPDSTELDGIMFQDIRHMRFYNGRPQTNGGTQQVSTTGQLSLAGCNRFLINYRKDDNNIFTVIGGDTKLWALLGGQLTNITPVQTASYSLSNSLATNYSVQGIAAALFAVLGIAFLRKPLLNRFLKAATHNIDVGKEIECSEVIAPHKTGRIKYQGTTWEALNSDSVQIEVGDRVHIVGVNGITLIIKKVM